MDELVPLYEPSGRPSGVCALKSEAHKYGWWHGTVHVWMVNEKKEILFQRRSISKATYPGLWDVSVAGHINGWENPPESAIREVQEELGLEIDGEYLRYIGCFPSEVIHGDSGIIDREYHHTFLYTLAVKKENLSPDPEEVAETGPFPADVTGDLFETGVAPGFVPHAPDYLKAVAEIMASVFPGI